jgi:hypothetical protein
MIVLSSDMAIKDLLDKRSGIYSDRMDSFVGGGLVSGGLRVLLMVCGTLRLPHHGLELTTSEIWPNMAYDPQDDPQHLEHYGREIIRTLPRPRKQNDAQWTSRATKRIRRTYSTIHEFIDDSNGFWLQNAKYQ